MAKQHRVQDPTIRQRNDRGQLESMSGPHGDEFFRVIIDGEIVYASDDLEEAFSIFEQKTRGAHNPQCTRTSTDIDPQCLGCQQSREVGYETTNETQHGH